MMFTVFFRRRGRRVRRFDQTQSSRSDRDIADNEPLQITMRSQTAVTQPTMTEDSASVSYGAIEPEPGSGESIGATTRTSYSNADPENTLDDTPSQKDELTYRGRPISDLSEVSIESKVPKDVAQSYRLISEFGVGGTTPIDSMEIDHDDDVYDVEPTFTQMAVRTSFATDYINHRKDFSPMRTPAIPSLIQECSSSHHGDDLTTASSPPPPPCQRDVAPLPKEAEYATMAAAAFYAAMQTHPLPLINFKDEHPLLYQRDAYVARRNQAKYMRTHRRSIQEQAGMKKPQSRFGAMFSSIGDSIKTLRAKKAHESETKKLVALHRRLSVVEPPPQPQSSKTT